MPAVEEFDKRLVVKSPKTGVGFPTDGSVLKMRNLKSVNGDVAPVYPVEYAKKVTLDTVHDATLTEKLSAILKLFAI
jgi:hypothetical protein